MRIVLLPYNTPVRGQMRDIPATDLRWLDGEPAGEQTAADLRADDHLIVYPLRRTILGSFAGLNCKVSLLLPEPWKLNRRIYLPVLLVWRKFFRIFTFQRLILRLVPNARFWIAANSWVGLPGDDEIAGKSRNMSLIASAKMLLGGHKLRHAVARWTRAEKLDVDLCGLAYRPLANKRDGLLPYRFSVVIENSQESGYFTEKLVDALLCGTVPIYWGATDVGKFFDVGGMLVCRSESEIRTAVQRADALLYDSMKPAILRNRDAARHYLDPERRAANMLRAEAG
jgi:Glycosyltransferase family 10 (fucosyltransferase) C-term